MIVYIKYNQARKKEFQLITTIEKEDGKLFVYKKAASRESEKFLRSLKDKYEVISKENFPFEAEKPTLFNSSARFNYLVDKTLDTLLFEAVLEKNKERVKGVFNEFKKIIFKIKTVDVFLDEEFEKIFGKTDKKKNKCIEIGALDLLLENIFTNKERPKLIDFEWLFNFPIPLKYICFRTIINTYFKYSSYNIAFLLPLKEVFKIFDISKSEEKDFLRYEYSFLVYAHKKDGVVDFDSYLNNFKSLGLNNRADFIVEAEMSIRQLAEVDLKNAELINKLSENEKENSNLKTEISLIKNSKMWRVRNFIVKVRRKLGLKRSWDEKR